MLCAEERHRFGLAECELLALLHRGHMMADANDMESEFGGHGTRLEVGVRRFNPHRHGERVRNATDKCIGKEKPPGLRRGARTNETLA